MIKILVIGAHPSSLINFRGEFLKSLAMKFDVIAMASGASLSEISAIEKLNVKYVDYPVQRNGLNPITDLKTLIHLYRLFRSSKPDIILAYTIKPVVWGGVAARLAGIKGFYALITGLGFAFQKGSFKRNILRTLVKTLYNMALCHSKGVIFQNPDNLNVFVEHRIVEKEKTFLVNGSGVDLSHFDKVELPSGPIFLLVARLLGEKGVREYAAAAKIIKAKYPEAIFQLVGPEDSSPDGIKLDEVNRWHREGVIDYLGATSDVRPFFANCSIFVLPSYHEGMPRTVLEAMATARPILTTNVPGCRETVVNGKNGFLVEKENVGELAKKMIWFIEHPRQWQSMADASYEMAKEKFDVNKVNCELMKIMGVNS